MSIDLEAQVLAVAEAMRERDDEVKAARSHEYYAENRQFILDRLNRRRITNHDSFLEREGIYRDSNRPQLNARARLYYARNPRVVASRQSLHFASIHEAKLVRESVAIKNGEYKSGELVRDGFAVGSENINAKLTEKSVRSIRALRNSGTKLSEISIIYGVSVSNLSSIVHWKTWKHVI